MISSRSSDNEILNLFRSRGFRVTPQRMAVALLVLRTEGHPSARRIHEEARRMHPSMSLTTVYKTIKILKEAGLVRELGSTNGERRFDPVTTPHAHLVCLRCGRISDWREPALPELLRDIEEGSGFIADGLEIYGTCSRCEKGAQLKMKDAI